MQQKMFSSSRAKRDRHLVLKLFRKNGSKINLGSTKRGIICEQKNNIKKTDLATTTVSKSERYLTCQTSLLLILEVCVPSSLL